MKPSISPLLFIFSDDIFLMIYYDMISYKPFILILIVKEGKYKRVGQCLIELFSVPTMFITNGSQAPAAVIMKYLFAQCSTLSF